MRVFHFEVNFTLSALNGMDWIMPDLEKNKRLVCESISFWIQEASGMNGR